MAEMMKDVTAGGQADGLKGERFAFQRCRAAVLELELVRVESLRREAARLELQALLAGRAFLVERLGLGLPADCQVKIVREKGVPIGIELVEPGSNSSSHMRRRRPARTSEPHRRNPRSHAPAALHHQN